MASDSFSDQLDDMIQLLQDYKSGSVKLDNITKLCQTLGLESFIDEIDSEISRLSTASKIIVIDIDFAKIKGKVTDVKLVLASNFDNFNYFTDEPESATASNNILLNSLALYPDLHEFHHNLKYLYLLDTYSNIDIDTSNTANNGSTNGNSSSGALTNENGANNAYSGKLDLFKYYTELAQFIRQFFAANSAPFKVETNLHNRFGIYISTANSHKPLAKIYFEKAEDPQQRLYEFIYSESNKDWVNESAESYTCGVSLVMDLQEGDLLSWFPRDFIPDDIVQEASNCDGIDGNVSAHFDLNDLLHGNKYKSECSGKFEVTNDFTTKLIRIKKFNIGNDNLSLILEVLNWLQWSQTVLYRIYALLIGHDEIATASGENGSPESQISSGAPRARRSSASNYRRRRFSNKTKRPSIGEAAMLKDEGIQQFTLHEIMTEPSVASSHSRQPAEDSVSLGALANDGRMDIDEAIDDDDDESRLQLVVSEDHVSLGDIAHCTLYDSPDRWNHFIDALQKQAVC